MTRAERLFREARPASFGRNYAKTLGQTAVFWAIFLVGLPWLVAAIESRLGMPRFEPRPVLGTVGFVALGAVALASGFMMTRHGEGTPLPTDAPRKLVVAGPYRWVRNPMAVTGLGQGAMTSLWFGSPSVIVYVLAGGLFWNRFVRPAEEADLLARHGEDFQHYRDTVRCWIPNRRPYEAPAP